MTENKADPRQVLGFVAWVDTFERIDTLLVEYRHAQVNLIHNLRAPVLYRFLRREEPYIWGQPRGGKGDDWYRLLCRPGFSAKELASKWVVPYPMPGLVADDEASEDKHEPTQRPRNEKALRKLQAEIQAFWNQGHWSLDQKRHYRILKTLQDIKADLVADRLTLCWWALWAFRVIEPDPYPKEQDGAQRLARFMVVRAGVMRKVYDYVERLRDLQAQFKRDLDMGFQDHPRPSLTRRREQGIYTGFLTERCRDMGRSIAMLLDSQSPPAPPPASWGSVLHRWNHDFTSRSFTQLHQVSAEGEEKRERHASFINSSFWMPERPDLQSVLAHEVAHEAVDRRYYSNDALTSCRDPFGRLLRLFDDCLRSFDKRQGNEHVSSRFRRSLIRELACDLLAATVEGHGYLLALFEEIAGSGLEIFFDHPDGRYDLELAHHLEHHGGLLDRGRSWYLRLRVTATWLQTIQHLEPSPPLDTRLEEGVLGLTEAMLDFLDRLHGSKRSQLHYWRSLGRRLCELARHSDAAADFRRWRKERSDDDLSDEASDKKSNGQDQGGSRAPWCFPRFSRRLPLPVRTHLYQRLVEQKCQPGYPCEPMREKDDAGKKRCKQKCKKWMSEHYFDGNEIDEKNPLIFRHIYDVAWQCMLTRSIDFLSGGGGARKRGRNWITSLQCHVALGREFYQLALEVHYDQSQSAYHYLLIVVHQLERLFEDEDKQHRPKLDPELRNKLQEWLDREQDKESHDQDWLNERIKELDNVFREFPPSAMRKKDKRDEFEVKAPDIAKHFTALAWRDFYGWFRHWGLEFYSERESDPDSSSQRYEERLRTLDKLLRRKLDQLIDTLGKQCGLKPGDPIYPLFSCLESTRLADEKGKDERMEQLIKALRPNGKFHVPDYYLIGRIAIAGSYPTQQEKSGRGSKPDTEDPDRLTCWLDRFKDRDYHWAGERTVCQPSQEAGKSGQHGRRYYQGVLGRYDLVSWIKTRPMCRCTLPQFPQPNGASLEPAWEIEEFPAFFVRREQAVPVRLDPKRPFPDDGTPVLAILSVTLTQRYARIDALRRLLRARDKRYVPYDKHGELQDGQLQIEQIGGLLQTNDRLFLTDGWDDLLLFLSGKPSEERLQEIFAIQGAFFEDFIVDRTELMLAADCIPVAAASPKFQLSVQLRLMEDRTLEYGNSAFREQVEKNLDGSKFWRDFKLHITLCRTPGRTDYTMTFPGLDGHLRKLSSDPKFRGFDAGRLFELFKGTRIDAIQTTVGRETEWGDTVKE
ncbi:hypothetical protein [Candidatus Thiosymbion oneisti]|uniref:hypothetical protein n=1 Tax=Candidatus Thiosymbion oneisti TaxID=589554 RepID=UPI000A4EFDAA|nr:hypothetical protein [Candidatus Thiosymbion oneisti]